jgi:lipid-A-disaccharide synthase-like uncharacterized protein
VSNMTLWLTVGFLGQALFTARFLMQWVVSEKKRDSVIPVAFWWLSLLGGMALLAYAVFRRDPVIITGQGMGLFVYTRNLMLVAKARARRPQPRSGNAGAGSILLCPHAIAPKFPKPLSTTGSLFRSPSE